MEERPGILEYSAYVAFYPSILTGPAFEFSDFRRWLRQEAEFSNIPFPGMRSLVIVLQGWTCGFTHLALNAYFPVTYLYDPEFTNNTFLFKAFYIFAAMETFRLKYLVAFSFADAGVISTGLGYKPDRNGNVSWERIRSINLKGYFWSSSIREVINSWNISVNLWLRRYVFNRVLKSDTKPTPSANRKFWAEQITFAVSAFWHGFYPGYYVFFFTMVFVNDLGKFYYQSDFSFIPFSRALDTIWWFYTMFLANYVGVTFALLSLERSFVSMASLNYHPFAWIAITWLFFKVTKYNIKYPRKGKIQ